MPSGRCTEYGGNLTQEGHLSERAAGDFNKKGKAIFRLCLEYIIRWGVFITIQIDLQVFDDPLSECVGSEIYAWESAKLLGSLQLLVFHSSPHFNNPADTFLRGAI